MSAKKYIQIAMPDVMRLAELTLKAKGSTRTMAKMSEACGVNTSTLSRIANGKITKPLSVEVLQSIFDHRPEDADITFSQFLIANGMADEDTMERGKRFTEQLLGVSEAKRHNENVRCAVKNIMVSELMKRDITVEKIPDVCERRRRNAPFGIELPFDFNFHIPKAPQMFWYFKVIDASDLMVGVGRSYQIASRFFLLDAWEPDFFEDSKTTFVFTHRLLFEQFIAQYHEAPIHAAMTAMLIDTAGEQVIDEVWLSIEDETPSVLTWPLTGGEGFIAAWEGDEDYDD